MARVRHLFDSGILRRNGIEGCYGTTLSLADAEVFGRAFGTLLREEGGSRVVLGFDGRLSSPDLAAAALVGLTKAGMTVLRIGRGPRPMLSFAVHRLDAHGGIMVTAARAPSTRNGLRFVFAAPRWGTREIRRLVEIAAEGSFLGGIGAGHERPVFQAYVRHLLDSYQGGRPLRTVWDAGHGAAGEVIAALARRLPGQHRPENEVIDGSFPLRAPDLDDPHGFDDLKRRMMQERRDLAFAFNSNGSRILALDDRGERLNGRRLLVLQARSALRVQPGARVVLDRRIGQGVLDDILALGGVPLRSEPSWPVIKKTMLRLNAALGGSSDGHVAYLCRSRLCDDALLQAINLLNAVSKLDEPEPLEFPQPKPSHPPSGNRWSAYRS